MSSRPALVIIADEDQAVREALQFALRLEGLCVRVHGGGAALLADPDLARAGCVILEERMRPVNGFVLLATLHERNIKPPAIILSSHATARVRARADAAGFVRLLEKPLLENVLMDDLRAILSLG